MIKKVIISILLLLFISPVCLAKTTLERNPALKKFEYTYNLKTLQTDLYPTLTKKISKFKLKDFTAEKGNEFVQDIFDILNSYHDTFKLRYIDNPVVKLYVEEVQDDTMVFFISVQLALLEADLRSNMSGLFIVTKIFYIDKIKIEPKKENTMPEKKTMGSSI